MRILLIGEASGVHRNLQKGLSENGVEALLFNASVGTSWPGKLGGVARNVVPFARLAALPNFDVANFINTITVVPGLWTRYRELPLIRNKVKVMSYYALGCDEVALIRHNSALPYAPCQTCLGSGERAGRDCEQWLNPRFTQSREIVQRYFDFGASSMIEYGHTEDLFPDHFKRIPLPVDLDPIEFQPAQARPITRIVHSPTRRGFKGTYLIIQAIDILRTMRSDFDFRIIEGLDYLEYLAAMRDADIVIDQVYSQSSGMVGLEMMAAGKVVLTGSTPLGRGYFAFGDESPALDAPPDASNLAQELSSTLDRKNEFTAIAEAGRAFVRKYHDPCAIAAQFLKEWRKQLDAAVIPPSEIAREI